MPATADTPRIQKLPPLVVNQIAAGEVVDRPASVVKELVDNALDARARRITVELEQGGIELVRVTDDGIGIAPDDLPLAIAPHATSKIRQAQDLDNVQTMGFRGEALASIASVSRLSIRSRREQDAAASMIEIEGDIAGHVRPAAGPVGTSVSVRNLFFNTPARRKFLRTPQTEQGHCVDMAMDLAMSHAAIGFRIVCDTRTVLDVPPDQGSRERVLAILGEELADELLEVHVDRFDDERGVAMWGLIGRPALARATAKCQHVYLNGRPIRDKTIQHAVREAYRGLIEPGRYPTVALMLEMDPRAVDVNVHPAKTEVRFRDQSLVHGLVLNSLRDALRKADLTPSVHFARPANPAAGHSGQSGIGFGANVGGDSIGVPMARSSVSPQAFVEFFTRPVSGAGNARLDYDAIRQAVEPVNAELKPMLDGTGAESTQQSETAADFNDTGTPGTPGTPGSSSAPTGSTSSDVQAPSTGSPDSSMGAPAPAQRLLQVHNSYVVTQDEQGLIIVDQHALHERAMFEFLLLRIGQGSLESQSLLLPAVVRLDPRQATRVEDLRPLLARLGIVVELLSPTDVGVQAFPSFLFERGVDPVDFMRDLMERAEAEGFSPESEAAMHEVLDMMACKAAVKAGDRLSERELGDLLRLRELVERSSNCPHGRPTSIRLTISELEKRFGRS